MSIPRFQNVPEINKSGMTFENYLRQIRLLKYSLPDMYDKYFYMIHDFYLKEWERVDVSKEVYTDDGVSAYDNLITNTFDFFTSVYIKNSFELFSSDDRYGDYSYRINNILELFKTKIIDAINNSSFDEWDKEEFMAYFITHSDFWYDLTDNYPMDDDNFKTQRKIADSDLREVRNLARSGLAELLRDDIPPHISDYISDLIWRLNSILSEYTEHIQNEISINKYDNIFNIYRYNNSIEYKLNSILKRNNGITPPTKDYENQKEIIEGVSDYLDTLNIYENYRVDLLNKLLTIHRGDTPLNTILNSIVANQLNIFKSILPMLVIYYQKNYNYGNTEPNDEQTTFYKVFYEILNDNMFKLLPTTNEDQQYNNGLFEKMGAMLLSNYMIVNTGDTPSINEVDDPYKYLAERGNFVSRLQRSGYTIVPYTPPTT